MLNQPPESLSVFVLHPGITFLKKHGFIRNFAFLVNTQWVYSQGVREREISQGVSPLHLATFDGNPDLCKAGVVRFHGRPVVRFFAREVKGLVSGSLVKGLLRNFA